MKFICFGYADQTQFQTMSEQELSEKMEECMSYDDVLRRGEHFAGGEALVDAMQAKTLRFRNGAVHVTDGPYAETKEQVGGILFLEAESMSQAVELMSKHPGVRIGPFEIRPADEAINAMLAERARRAANPTKLDQRLSMEQANVQPYLFFAGRCDEALEFYKSSLRAEIGMVLRFNESPEPLPPGMLQAGFETKIMHSEFNVGGMTLMASDGCDDKSRFDGFRLALSVPSEAEVDRIFNALSAGGKIDMPLTKTFWSPRYGMVTDKFGVGWMVMVPGPRSA